MEERWKDIKGYEGLYQISDLGRVKSLGNNKTKKDKILKNTMNNAGYYYIDLSKDNIKKRYTIHRLVGIYFVDGYKEGYTVNHINECKTDNKYTNLQWCSQQENTLHSSHKWAGGNNYNAKKIICVETGEIYPSISDACKDIGRSFQSMHRAIKTSGTCGGYHWKYV